MTTRVHQLFRHFLSCARPTHRWSQRLPAMTVTNAVLPLWTPRQPRGSQFQPQFLQPWLPEHPRALLPRQQQPRSTTATPTTDETTGAAVQRPFIQTRQSPVERTTVLATTYRSRCCRRNAVHCTNSENPCVKYPLSRPSRDHEPRPEQHLEQQQSTATRYISDELTGRW